MKHFFLLSALAFGVSAVDAQDTTKVKNERDTTKTTVATENSPLQISGYADVYYSYYTDSVGRDKFQKFPTTSPRSNSFGLNIAMITAKYTTEKIRSTITVHYGDIALTTWSPKYNFIQEANVGVRLHKKLWLDAGFFRTHIGTEGLFAKENIVSSLAVGTFNEPYYQAGAKLMYTPSDKLSVCFHVLNGYNMFEDNNEKKSLGLLVNYTVNDKLSFGYSNYYGDDTPSSDITKKDHTRFYNNLYMNYAYKKIKIQMGGDYGIQQHSDTTGKKQATMFSALTTVRYQCFSKTGIYTRGEIFNDPSGFLAGTITDKRGKTTGYKLYGVTFGVEYKPTDNSYIKIEGRQLETDVRQQIFHWNKKNSSIRHEIMIHTGIYF